MPEIRDISPSDAVNPSYGIFDIPVCPHCQKSLDKIVVVRIVSHAAYFHHGEQNFDIVWENSVHKPELAKSRHIHEDCEGILGPNFSTWMSSYIAKRTEESLEQKIADLAQQMRDEANSGE